MLLIIEIFESFLGKCRGHNEKTGQTQFDCPVCSEEQGFPDGNGKGNLEINYNLGVFKCWACGERNNMKGYLPKLIRKYGNNKLLNDFYLLRPEFKTQIEHYSDTKIKLPDNFRLISETSKYHNMYGEVMHYLKKRGVSGDLIKEKKIGFCDEGKYKGRIIIPSYDINGELNYFVGRAIFDWMKPKVLNEFSDKSSVIFNEHLINWDSTIYLVEGPFDHIVTPNSITLLGKYVSEYLFTKLQMKAKWDVVIFLDGDAWEDSKNIYRKLNVGNLRGRIKAIRLKYNYDPSKIYEKFGRKKFIEVLSKANTIMESRL